LIVRKRIGVLANMGVERMNRQTSMPSHRGMTMSRITKSGVSPCSRRIASWPLRATISAWPSRRKERSITSTT
jgi:hypothetical protein